VEQLSDSITFLHKGKTLACQDKETYIEGWRRVLCSGTLKQPLDLPGVAEFKSNGSLHEIKIRGFEDAMLANIHAQGLQVSQVERMTLEQIFIASVREVAKQ
jgi:ABC-2 type transport system ATP-binding protein